MKTVYVLLATTICLLANGCSEKSEIERDLSRLSLSELQSNPAAMERARILGESLYKQGLCIGCHQTYQKRSKLSSYTCPAHSDDNWYWGGDLEDLFHTIKFGVRDVEPVSTNIPCDGPNGIRSHPPRSGTRWSVMPRFDQILTKLEIQTLAAAVTKLTSGNNLDETEKTLFVANCATCHGQGGEGDSRFGAPRLSDDHWEVSLARDNLEEFISFGGYILTSFDRCFLKHGPFSSSFRRSMQAFGNRSCGMLSNFVSACYSDSEIIALAVYVRSLSQKTMVPH